LTNLVRIVSAEFNFTNLKRSLSLPLPKAGNLSITRGITCSRRDAHAFTVGLTRRLHNIRWFYSICRAARVPIADAVPRKCRMIRGRVEPYGLRIGDGRKLLGCSQNRWYTRPKLEWNINWARPAFCCGWPH
jgi:hypothetical protein